MLVLGAPAPRPRPRPAPPPRSPSPRPVPRPRPWPAPVVRSPASLRPSSSTIRAPVAQGLAGSGAGRLWTSGGWRLAAAGARGGEAGRGAPGTAAQVRRAGRRSAAPWLRGSPAAWLRRAAPRLQVAPQPAARRWQVCRLQAASGEEGRSRRRLAGGALLAMPRWRAAAVWAAVWAAARIEGHQEEGSRDREEGLGMGNLGGWANSIGPWAFSTRLPLPVFHRRHDSRRRRLPRRRSPWPARSPEGKMKRGVLLGNSGGRWGSCPTLPHGELRL